MQFPRWKQRTELLSFIETYSKSMRFQQPLGLLRSMQKKFFMVSKRLNLKENQSPTDRKRRVLLRLDCTFLEGFATRMVQTSWLRLYRFRAVPSHVDGTDLVKCM